MGPGGGWIHLERETGIEPATSTLARWRSTAELFPLGKAKDKGGSAPTGGNLLAVANWTEELKRILASGGVR